MSIAGIALAIILVIVVGYLTPFWVRRRQAILLSREGDRFSGGLRVVTDTAGAKEETLQTKDSAGMPLLTPRATGNQGSDMNKKESTGDTTRPGSQVRVKLSPRQARDLARLKSARAARLSQEKSQAQRRFLASILSFVLLVTVIVLAALSILSWWWLLAPAFILTAVTVTSRAAAVRSKKTAQKEDERLRELCAGFTRPTPVKEKPKDRLEVASAVLASEEMPHAKAPTPAVTEPQAASSSVEKASQAEEKPADNVSKSQKWEVPALPQPTYMREKKAASVRVHPDTDIIAVAAPKSKVVRPLEASKVEDGISSAEAASTYNLDIEAVLEARRAQ